MSGCATPGGLARTGRGEVYSEYRDWQRRTGHFVETGERRGYTLHGRH